MVNLSENQNISGSFIDDVIRSTPTGRPIDSNITQLPISEIV